MTTIDKLDISVYNRYAMQITMLEQLQSQLRLNQASTIPPQLSVVDIYPRMSELDLLLGVVPLATPWAYFYPPKKFEFLRRNPFAFHRVAPAFGNKEKQEEDEEKVSHAECHTADEKREKEVLGRVFKQLDKLNDMMSHIIGRLGQFLQG